MTYLLDNQVKTQIKNQVSLKVSFKVNIESSKLKFFRAILFIILMGVSSCGDTPYYNKAFSFKNHIWNQNVKPKFEFEISDTTKFYDMLISVRTTSDYAYNNMWIYLKTTTPSKLEAREPFQIRIADDKGEWLGTKTGTTIQNELKFSKRKFPEIGKYTWYLEQGITENEIKEVLDVNVQIRQYEEPN